MQHTQKRTAERHRVAVPVPIWNANASEALRTWWGRAGRVAERQCCQTIRQSIGSPDDEEIVGSTARCGCGRGIRHRRTGSEVERRREIERERERERGRGVKMTYGC